MFTSISFLACTIVFQGAVVSADQVDDYEHESQNGHSLLQVGSVMGLPPMMEASVDAEGTTLVKAGRGVGRAVCELLAVCLAVLFWAQLKEGIWPALPAQEKTLAPNDAVQAVMLHEAVRDNDLDTIRKQAVRGDVDHRDHLDRTPLHIAAALGRMQAAELLIDYGADASARDFDDATPCWVAGANNHREVVRMLLEGGAVVGGQDCSIPPVVAQELAMRMLG